MPVNKTYRESCNYVNRTVLKSALYFTRLFQTCIIVKRTRITIFSKIRLVDQSKPCTQIYLQKFLICINLQLAIRISKNRAL